MEKSEPRYSPDIIILRKCLCDGDLKGKGVEECQNHHKSDGLEDSKAEVRVGEADRCFAAHNKSCNRCRY